jgi:hypothetical protein
MRSTIRRHALVLALILATAVAGQIVAAASPPAPAIPRATGLLGGSGWHAADASPPLGDTGTVARQWRLSGPAGRVALLYVAATVRPQVMLRWSGELGYQGEGYVVSDRGERPVRLTDGRTVSIAHAEAQRLDDRRLLEYAVVDSGGGVIARGTSSLLRTVWAALAGSGRPYHLVRVSASEAGAGAQAARDVEAILVAVVSRLALRDEAGSG